ARAGTTRRAGNHRPRPRGAAGRAPAARRGALRRQLPTPHGRPPGPEPALDRRDAAAAAVPPRAVQAPRRPLVPRPPPPRRRAAPPPHAPGTPPRRRGPRHHLPRARPRPRRAAAAGVRPRAAHRRPRAAAGVLARASPADGRDDLLQRGASAAAPALP